MTTLLNRIESRIANRDTIANTFGTDQLTTHRILSNCNFNFILDFLANGDRQKAQQLWEEAHPFRYPAHDSRDFHSMDIEFVSKHLTLFGTKQFWTGGGWGKFDDVKKIVPWEYKSGYRDISMEYLKPCAPANG